jgi:hypothetical protein
MHFCVVICSVSATQNNVTSFVRVEQLANILSYGQLQQEQKMVKKRAV